MKDIQYFLMKIRYRLSGNDKEVISDYFRKMGMHIGKKCAINSNIASTEGYLVSLGDNVTIAGNVSLITHDNSVSKMIPNSTDVFGRIKIGNNCFIGGRSVIMYGVELADDIIVASGSVVTKSFHRNRIVIGGNPARIIGDYDSFIEKMKDKVFNLDEIARDNIQTTIESNESKLIVRQEGN